MQEEILSTFSKTSISLMAEPEPFTPSDLSPEPEPDFEIAKEVWGDAWPVHFYLFGAIFSLLLLYNINSLLGLYFKTARTIRRRNVFIAINWLLLWFNFSSATHLLIDPYESNEYFNSNLVRKSFFIIHGLRMPCLTASFSLVFISLLETTKLNLYSPRLQDRRYISTLIAIHFITSLTIHLYLVFEPSKFRILIICNVYFILFGTILAVLSAYACYRIIMYIRTSNTNLRDMITPSTSRMAMLDMESDLRKSRTSIQKLLDYDPSMSIFADKSLERLLILITIISGSGLVLFSAVVYSLRLLLDNQGDGLLPWPWYIYQTTARCAEAMMVFAMSKISRRSILPHCKQGIV
ncbi:uncharacterized protein LOC130654566 [Hydractinia symbiolongicarpus]|uniref:uncharacterized protein LOC130654566 n=1 Tax=Hydractinia symbiolongicarpus TaxID=13093 RepID=UPI00254AB045|nr:uncharacterized protein LOC130654566 [Hydractinia symbiolongicarpus]